MTDKERIEEIKGILLDQIRLLASRSNAVDVVLLPKLSDSMGELIDTYRYLIEMEKEA